MIISHKFKFIFFKTNKTAGTSIEIALSKFCGPDDIITPISKDDEEIRKKNRFTGPQNYYAPVKDYRFKDIARLLIKRKPKKRFYNHITANEVKQFIDEQTWQDYYKFCFERNPWDRVVSLYYARCRTEPRPSISDFMKTVDVWSILKKGGNEVYTIDDNIAVNRVCRFEKMQEEIDYITQYLQLPEKIILPKAKSSFRKDKRHAKDILSDSEFRKTQAVFKKEIELFGYSD